MENLLRISVHEILIHVSCYFLFEPIAVHNLGRKNLIDLSNLPTKINHSDSILYAEDVKISTYPDKLLGMGK